MGVISLEQAQPSMVLTTPVKDRNGRLLIPAGKVLSERHIESLKMWGVPTVEVEGASPSGGGGDRVDPELVMEAERSVAVFFSSNDLTHPFLSALSKYCVRKEARALSVLGQKAADGRQGATDVQ